MSAADIGIEAALASGGDALFGAFARNINLKGMTRGLSDDVANQYAKNLGKASGRTPEQVALALRESITPKNVFADPSRMPKDMPNPVENPLNISTPAPKPMEAPKVNNGLDDWVNFAQQGKGPKARPGFEAIQNPARYGKEALTNQADTILNRSNALKNTPEGGYNNRLLAVQKEMQTVGGSRGIYRKPLSPDELYLKAKQPGDPSTFDELIKLAEMEHNVATTPKDLKRLLDSDPRIREGIQKLNAFGGLSKKSVPPVLDQPNLKPLDEMLTPLKQEPTGTLPNGDTFKLPELGGVGNPSLGISPLKNPLGRLRELLTAAQKKEAGTLPIEPNLSPLKPGKDFEAITSGPQSNDGELARVADDLLDAEKQASGDVDSFRSKVDRTPNKDKNRLFSNLRTQFIDDVAPLETLEKNIAGEIGSAENSLYKQARLFKGSPEKAHLLVKEQLNPVLKVLQDNNLTYQDLGDYALAVHAKDVNGKGINSGFTNAEIDDVIQHLGTPEMEAARVKLLGVNNNVLDMLSSGGIIDNAQVAAMREKYPNYVSLFRSFDDDKVEFAGGVGKALANASSPIKKLQGSNRAVIEPMESVIKN
ncbi:MAG: hypothetical protein K6T88_22680, partial [Bacillus sp. (in: Bacteria)]|nr:hypothetical protein [Bacillus sp. (in: firmicutes)]